MIIDIEKELDKAFNEEMKKDNFNKRSSNLENKIKDIFNITSFWHRGRTREYVYARNVYWYIMYNFYKGVTLLDISHGRDHTTVMHGIQNVKDSIEYSGCNPELFSLYLQVENKLNKM